MSFRDSIIRALGGTPAADVQAMHARAMEITQPARAGRRELLPGIRRGMWGVWQDRPVIVNDMRDGLLELHVINPDGTTLYAVHQSPLAVRQARISEVPEPRRNIDALRSLGYED